VAIVLGTRPEAIKLAPVIRELLARSQEFRPVVIGTGQHADLVRPMLDLFQISLDYDLGLMQPRQTPTSFTALALAALEPVLQTVAADAVLVQGDTCSAVAGAWAAFHLRIPVGHVEAGLRSGDAANPFPEEMNRRLITRLASWHFCPTAGNRRHLLAEGVPDQTIFVTGNPVVDALLTIRNRVLPSERCQQIIQAAQGRRILVLTLHRRENQGDIMAGYLTVLRDFVASHADVELVFPVHPSPAVRAIAHGILGGTARVQLVEPLPYADFLALVQEAWLIASDSGGIQEEAPTLGKPLLVLRQTTERPEAIRAGVARLVGQSSARFRTLLEQAYADDRWTCHLRQVVNPFGKGDSAQRIVTALARVLGVSLHKVAV
jgi:UDP-N-acetylglucosamine 2-epimerase (non-hydrolysing)